MTVMETNVRDHFKKRKNSASCSVYFPGIIGAAVYYITQATGFWMGVLGFLKALVWPVFFVYEGLKFFGA